MSEAICKNCKYLDVSRGFITTPFCSRIFSEVMVDSIRVDRSYTCVSLSSSCEKFEAAK